MTSVEVRAAEAGRPAHRVMRSDAFATQRLRLAAICGVLVTLVFSQHAGKVATDTKLDLVVDPLKLLARGLTLWDPNGASGQLQNQGYGYLFPIGPFYLLGHWLNLSPWVTQRAWESLLVVVAFLGTVRLSRLLGVREFWPKVAAGLAYALAPRMLSELGSISSELMPVAALPWVLIPLVAGARTGSPRRAAARSGVALLLAGGVNAAATVAILPAPALWLLTRTRGPRRRQLALWWATAVVLACTWWAVPLVLLGRYSPPFLDWIEPSSLTTAVTSLFSSLRGVDHWESYLGPGVWPAGWIFVAVPAVILATTGVAAGGLAGLARASTPHATFLRSLLIVGLILLTAGHVASVGPPFAGDVRTLLDGPLNAFRNIHKFDPLVRLPLAIGLGHLVGRVRVPEVLRTRLQGYPIEIPARRIAALGLLTVGIVAVAPAVTGRLIPNSRTTVDASWWHQTSTWLAHHSAGGRALVVPGSPRPVYLWGPTVDEALQPLADSPWAVRDGIPLGQAGYIRLLDSIEARFAAGTRDTALAPLLARAGMRYLVVRNDLDVAASGATPLAYVHATIAQSPGFARVATFGPPVGFPATETQLYDAGASGPRPAVEIFSVAGWTGTVALESGIAPLRANGSADQLGNLLDRGLRPDTPVLFGADGDAPLAEGPVVATDGLRRRTANFGHATLASGTMTADQPFATARAAQDYLPPDPGPLSTMAYGGGLADISASSSGAAAGALINASRANGAWSAVDGDPTTAWESSAITGPDGQWIQARFTRPIAAARMQLAFAPNLGGYPTRLAIRTDAGELRTDVSPSFALQSVALPRGSTQNLRITVLATTRSARAVGISTLSVPGIQPTRSLTVPILRSPDILAFDVDPGARGSCLTTAAGAACDPAFAAQGEEDGSLNRSFALPAARDFLLSATVRLRGGGGLNALLDAAQPITATATSVANADPRERPSAAVDGNARTAWVAGAGDKVPSLTLHLSASTLIDHLVLSTETATAVARPLTVRVTVGDEETTADVGTDGIVELPRPVQARTVRIDVLRSQLRQTTLTASGVSRLVPVGISEVQVNGVANSIVTDPIRIGCDAGVSVIVDGRVVGLRVTATRAQALTGAIVDATPCGAGLQSLPAGRQDVRFASSAVTTPYSLTFARPGASMSTHTVDGSAVVVHWHATSRTVRVRSAGTGVLVVRENYNAGWTASIRGHDLRAIRVDGWQQGFVVPAGADGLVQLRFAPQRSFVVGLVVGGMFAILLLVLASAGRQRPRLNPLRDGVVRPAVAVVALAAAATLLVGWVGAVLVFVLWRAERAVLSVFGRPLPWWLGGAVVGTVGLADATWWQLQDRGVSGLGWAQVAAATGVVLVASRATTVPRVRPDSRSSRGRSR